LAAAGVGAGLAATAAVFDLSATGPLPRTALPSRLAELLRALRIRRDWLEIQWLPITVQRLGREVHPEREHRLRRRLQDQRRRRNVVGSEILARALSWFAPKIICSFWRVEVMSVTLQLDRGR
jgi:hypothetical protein